MNASRRVLVSAVILALMLSLVPIGGVFAARPVVTTGFDSTAIVKLSVGSAPSSNPSLPIFCGADTSTYTINFSGVTNLWGYQFEAHYDPLLVTATGAWVNSWFDTTGASKPWDPTDPLTPCSGGTCKFGVSKVAGTGVNPVTGGGPVATITFTGIAAGNFNLTFDNVLLSDRDAQPIAQTLAAVPFTVCGIASAGGTVSLQGRATPGGVAPLDPPGSVTLTDGVFGPYSSPINPTTGQWSINNIKVMPTGTTYTFDATHGLYLGNRMTHALNPGDAYAVPATNTRLKGGDANNSGTIEIGDLSCIGGAFGAAPVVCGTTGSSDINWDTTTNILDLVLAGGNYGLTTPPPLPW